MKKTVLTVIMFSLFLGIFLAGCGSDAESVQGTEGKKGTGSEQTSDVVFELKYSTDFGPERTRSKLLEEAFGKIEERTNGRVKITPYYNGSLIQSNNVYQSVASGIADIANYTLGTGGNIQKFNEFLILPKMGAPGYGKIGPLYREIFEKFPEFQQEMQQTNTRWLLIDGYPNYQLHTIDKQVRVPDDLKGMTIIASGYNAQIVEAAGGAAVYMGPPDWYSSLERGVANGQITHWAVIGDMKTTELFTHYTLIGDGGFGSPGSGYIINLDTWNSLPPEFQAILEEEFLWAETENIKVEKVNMEEYMEQERQAGDPIIELTPEEIEQWKQLADPIIEKWIEEAENEGWPARQAYEEFQKLVEEYDN